MIARSKFYLDISSHLSSFSISFSLSTDIKSLLGWGYSILPAKASQQQHLYLFHSPSCHADNDKESLFLHLWKDILVYLSLLWFALR